MDLKAHAVYGLHRTRWLTERTLAGFVNQDDWFFQAHPKANHALWIVAHLGLADNAFVSRFRPDRGSKPEGWDELFWFGSALKDDWSAYPSSSEVLAYFRERRETLLSVIEELSDDEISADGPPADAMDPIAGAPNAGEILLFASRHEATHFGQLTVAHRGLGNDPIMAPK